MSDPATNSGIVYASLDVYIRGLALEAEIGIYPHERGKPQPLVVDLEVTLDPVAVETLSETINYESLAAAARDLATGGHIDLVETYAQRLAQACLADPRVLSARVKVDKPQAIPDAEAAGVVIVVRRG